MLFFEIGPSILAGLTVSMLHAAIPTHWLPFVLAAKSQSWSYKKTLSILFIAGLGHVVTTTLLGALAVWFGLNVHNSLESIVVYITAVIVFIFGLYNIVQYKRGYQHSHCDHSHPHHHDHGKVAKDGWAVLGLLAMLTFSPCEAFLPVYISAWPTGWVGFVALSIVLALGTLMSMIFFMSAAFFGLKQIKMNWLESHEKLVNGLILIALSVFVCLTAYYFPHHH